MTSTRLELSLFSVSPPVKHLIDAKYEFGKPGIMAQYGIKMKQEYLFFENDCCFA